MSLSLERKAADDAAGVLLRKRSQQSIRSGGIIRKVDQWRPLILVGSGLLGGYLLGQRSTARLASNVVSLTNLGMTLMRSPFGPPALLAVFAKRMGSEQKVSRAEAPGTDNRPAH